MRGYVVFHGMEALSGSWLGEQHEFRALAIVLTNPFVLADWFNSHIIQFFYDRGCTSDTH